MKRITVLIPVFNEGSGMNLLLDRLNSSLSGEKLAKYSFEYLFVNDGSRDETYEIIKKAAESEPADNKRISYINLSRNFGKETAMIAGIDNTESDAAVIIDADLQDPPELIEKMVELWEQGYQDVYAKRISRKGETFVKKFTSKCYYHVLQKSTSIPIQIDTGDFRLLDRKCLDALKNIRETGRNTKALFSWIGYKKKEIVYERDPRVVGNSKLNYKQLINLALDGIMSFTIFPLRISFILGSIVSLISFVYASLIILKTLIFGSAVPGYASLMTIILLLGGIQLLSIGILGEYIGRIFIETKQRPLYYIEEAHRAKTAD
ncbi:MAG: glycosyltransferase family 2 protein [Candidatus Ancillula trichonymphae]|jgi:glycosyltransferase involved in cell wall biosynthesis|nr:glycosyltransferase family 2 protein [Candidatus Ancillula trichonymphae]